MANVLVYAEHAHGNVPKATAVALAAAKAITAKHGGGDTILVRRDGRELSVDASAAPIRDRTTRIVGAVLVLKDVTRERQTTAQLAHQPLGTTR